MTDRRKAKRSARAIVSLAVGVAMIAALGAVLVQRPSCRTKDTHWTTVHFDAAPVAPDAPRLEAE